MQGNYEGPATHDMLDGLVVHLETELDANGYFFPDHRVDAMKRTLRTVLTRPGFTSHEVRTLRGVIKGLVEFRGQKR
jgi:tRNA/rRNA methyltransferase